MIFGADHIPSVVMASKGFKPGGKTNPPSKPKVQPDGGKCTHCGSTKHTRESLLQTNRVSRLVE